MNQLLKYLQREGVYATLNKVKNKVFGHNKSCTVFLKNNGGGVRTGNIENFEIERLTEVNRKDFEKIKFWDFVNTDEFINNPKQSILLLKAGEEYVAYAAEEHEICREIHELGKFQLRAGEGWIGPVYVLRGWRGRGINKALVAEQIKKLQASGIDTFYTSINSNNEASLNSFKYSGFCEIGRVDSKGCVEARSDCVLFERFTNN